MGPDRFAQQGGGQPGEGEDGEALLVGAAAQSLREQGCIGHRIPALREVTGDRNVGIDEDMGMPPIDGRQDVAAVCDDRVAHQDKIGELGRGAQSMDSLLCSMDMADYPTALLGHANLIQNAHFPPCDMRGLAHEGADRNNFGATHAADDDSLMWLGWSRAKGDWLHRKSPRKPPSFGLPPSTLTKLGQKPLWQL